MFPYNETAFRIMSVVLQYGFLILIFAAFSAFMCAIYKKTYSYFMMDGYTDSRTAHLMSAALITTTIGFLLHVLAVILTLIFKGIL